MCIAIVKPMGVKTPSKKTLLECWNNNPDGAGYCYNDGKKVTIHKGFMTFNAFYKSFKQLDYTNCDLIIHFRIATHGGVSKECTHPFMISKNINDLKKLDTTCKSAFVHNGIISGYGSYTQNGVSDTMDYVTKIIAYIPHVDTTLLNNLANEKNSRFALITKNNVIKGGTWVKDNGVFYSNSSYKPKPKITKAYAQSPITLPSYTCEWCGQKTYFPHTVNYYGDTYGICYDCYQEYLETVGYYSKSTNDIKFTK